MLDVRLRYQDDGKFQSHTLVDFKTIAAGLTPGDVVRARITLARTVTQNNTLHWLAQMAWENHQPDCPPDPEQVPTWEHMKSWLLIAAGHCDVETFERGEIAPAAAMRLRKRYHTIMWTVRGDMIFMKTARSTSNLNREEFTDLLDRILTVIGTKVIPGVDMDSLKEMAKAKAA